MDDGEYSYLGAKKSEIIYNSFKEHGYINSRGEVQDSLRKVIKENTLEVPESVAESALAIIAVCKKVCGSLKIKSADDKRTISLNKELFLGDDFKALWDKIKHKTTYSVDFSSQKLIERCLAEIKRNLNVGAPKLVYLKAKFNVSAGGIDAEETAHTTVLATNVKENLPDIVTYLQNKTNLTRKTVVTILTESKKLNLFKRNPQRYMEEVSAIILSVMKLMIVDGIKYTRLGNDEYYAQELFDTEELTGYLERNMIKSERSIYSYVVYDSDVERGFAEKFESNENILVYTKLPSWFKISTPLGSYNPDWAVLIKDDGENKLYFIVETKGSVLTENLRPTEDKKIICGQKHFEALGQCAVFARADNYNNFIKNNNL